MNRRPTRSNAPVVALLSLIVLLAVPLCAAEEPSPAAAPPPDPGTGALYARTAAGLQPLPTLSIDAEIRVTGILVQGTLRQTFRNDGPTTIEALYVFPLPEGAAVDSFELTVGDRVIRSVIRERAEARATYGAAKASGKKAGLVEFARRGLFKTSVAGINPGESVSVALRFYDEAAWRDGTLSLSLPLTWTPRFTVGLTPGDPAACRNEGRFVSAVPTSAAPISAAPTSATAATTDSTPAPTTAAAQPPEVPALSVRVTLEPGFEATDIHSNSHRVNVTGASDGASYEVTSRPGAVPDRDFLLEWRPVRGRRPGAAVFLEPHADALYALAMILPGDPSAPDGAISDPGLPTRTLFIVDVSGSMQGASLEQAKAALVAALQRLGASDAFNILKFSSGSTAYRETFQPATPARLAEAIDWVRGLQVEGGTEILEALEHAGRLIAAEPSRMVTRAILITDGAVEADDTAIAAATRGLAGTRVSAIGIGPAPNRPLMRALARAGRGATEFIGSIDDVRTRLDAFLDSTRRPVLAELSLTWDGAAPLDARPERLPDLHSGEPLLVSLRLDRTAPGAQGWLRGVGSGGRFETPLTIAPEAPTGAGIAVRWARARVNDLLDGLAAGADEKAVRAAVLPVALEHGLVTPYTSLVAVEEKVTAGGPSVPANAPSVVPGSAGDGVDLAQGGTDNPFWLKLGVVFLLFGLVLGLAARFLP